MVETRFVIAGTLRIVLVSAIVLAVHAYQQSQPLTMAATPVQIQ